MTEVIIACVGLALPLIILVGLSIYFKEKENKEPSDETKEEAKEEAQEPQWYSYQDEEIAKRKQAQNIRKCAYQLLSRSSGASASDIMEITGWSSGYTLKFLYDGYKRGELLKAEKNGETYYKVKDTIYIAEEETAENTNSKILVGE